MRTLARNGLIGHTSEVILSNKDYLSRVIVTLGKVSDMKGSLRAKLDKLRFLC